MGADMFEKAQRDRFWLVLGAVLVALFVIQKERGLVDPAPRERQEVRVYDRGGMDRLVEKTIEIPTTSARPAAPGACCRRAPGSSAA